LQQGLVPFLGVRQSCRFAISTGRRLEAELPTAPCDDAMIRGSAVELLTGPWDQQGFVCLVRAAVGLGLWV